MEKKIISETGINTKHDKPIIKQLINKPLILPTIQTKDINLKKTKYIPKILAGNGRHKALVFIQGILYQNGTELRLKCSGGDFSAKLHSNLFWVFKKYPHAFEETKNYICYPKLKDGIIKRLDIVLYSSDQIYSKERWEFIGAWNVKHQKLIVQRDINICPVSPHQYNYNFANASKWEKSLWDKYCYQIIAHRDKEMLNITNVKWIACPMKKPRRGKK